MSADYPFVYPVSSRWSFGPLSRSFLCQSSAKTAPAMCHFGRLNDMVCSALPYGEEWSHTPVHRDQLEVALASVASLVFGFGSKYNLALLSVMCSIAGHILSAGDKDAGDLSPSHWVVDRPSPSSVITWVLSLPQAQAHLWHFNWRQPPSHCW
jgi:hypothetical protein